MSLERLEQQGFKPVEIDYSRNNIPVVGSVLRAGYWALWGSSSGAYVYPDRTGTFGVPVKHIDDPSRWAKVDPDPDLDASCLDKVIKWLNPQAVIVGADRTALQELSVSVNANAQPAVAVRHGDRVGIGVLPVDFGIEDADTPGDNQLAAVALKLRLKTFEAGMGYVSYVTGYFTPVEGIHVVSRSPLPCTELPERYPGVPLG